MATTTWTADAEFTDISNTTVASGSVTHDSAYRAYAMEEASGATMIDVGLDVEDVITASVSNNIPPIDQVNSWLT